MEDYITIKFKGGTPLIATAIHNGHLLSENLLELSALNDSERLREEDPFTGLWTDIAENSVVAHHSRFEFDLNRPPDKAIYLLPSDAWGLNLWKNQPPAETLSESLQRYRNIYSEIHKGLIELLEEFGAIAIFDLHSYNHLRNGPDAPPEDPALNPEVNIGTGTMDRNNWTALVERFLADLRGYDFLGRNLDVRENIKFKGGYFPRWIHEKFNGSICCISIEVKKFFMDEWTGEPDYELLSTLQEALKSTVPGVLDELSKYKSNH